MSVRTEAPGKAGLVNTWKYASVRSTLSSWKDGKIGGFDSSCIEELTHDNKGLHQ